MSSTARLWFVFCFTLVALMCVPFAACAADPAADPKQADELLSAKKFDEAVSLLATLAASDGKDVTLDATLDAYIKQHPEDACDIHYAVGKWYQTQQKYLDAAGELKQALDLNTKPVGNWQLRDTRRRLLNCYFAGGAEKKATALLADLVAHYPSEAAAFYAWAGSQYQSRNKLDDAIDCFKKAVAAGSPDNDVRDAREKLFDCYLAKSDSKTALSGAEGGMFDQLCKDYPDKTGHFYNILGRRYQIQNKSADAAAAFKKALELGQSSLPAKEAREINERLASCYKSMGDQEGYRKQIELMIVAYPEEAARYKLQLGWFYLESQSYEKAALVFSEVVEKYPAYAATARVSLIEASSRLGKGNEEMAKLKDYYKDKPELRAEFLSAYGQSLFWGPQDYKRAATVLEQFVKEYPNDPGVPRARNCLLVAYEQSGQTEKAADALQALINAASGKQKNDLIMRKAGIYFSGRKYREAADMYRGVLALHDSTEDARAHAEYQLGVCYHYSNMDTAARQAMQNVAKRYPELQWARKARGMVHVWDTYGDAADGR